MSSGSNSADGAVFVMKIVSQTVAMINSYLNAFYRITIWLLFLLGSRDSVLSDDECIDIRESIQSCEIFRILLLYC